MQTIHVKKDISRIIPQHKIGRKEEIYITIFPHNWLWWWYHLISFIIYSIPNILKPPVVHFMMIIQEIFPHFIISFLISFFVWCKYFKYLVSRKSLYSIDNIIHFLFVNLGINSHQVTRNYSFHSFFCSSTIIFC